MAREFVLSGLGAYCNDRTGKTKCLDAFSASGISGLLWKHHVTLPLEVTVNDVSPECVESIRGNCEKNGYTVREFSLVEEDFAEKSIEVSQEDANILMHRRQFNFISVDPFGTTVQYLDATFKNVYHKGMVVLTSTDIAALYGKCPQVTLRNYAAFTVRTDYTKEMAVRILLAEAARSAAKCNKGFDVVYSLAVEHFVQVGVKIKRGANHGNQAMSQIGQILHCRHCQEWGRLPTTNSPIDNPYQYLPCKCNSEKPGKTAVVLGPMWLGEIFSTDFLKLMSEKAEEYKLSDRARSLLQTMQVESRCPDYMEEEMSTVKPVNTNAKLATDLACQSQQLRDHENKDCVQSKGKSKHLLEEKDCVLTTNLSNIEKSEELTRSKALSEIAEKNNHDVKSTSNGGLKVSDNLASGSVVVEKRQLGVSDNREENTAKKMRKKVRLYATNEMPTFYYNLHLRGVKKVDVPKVPRLLSKLHAEGFRASKTMFDSHAVRTDASLPELTEILYKYFAQKK